MSPLTYEHRWTGFEPITTASPTNKLQLKPRSGFVFLSALPDWATIGNWKCRIRTAPLRPRRSVLHFTPHSHQQPQRESNPCFRSDSPAYSPLYYEAMFYGRLLRLCFGGQAVPANNYQAMFWRASSAGKQLSCYVLAGRQCRQTKRPPVWLDKRHSQQFILEFVWSSHGSLWSSRSQTSTWSGHIKAYTNKPFRIFDGRHNCSLKIKHAICIFVCSILQHCLSFPDLLSFFLRLIYHLRFGLSFNLWYKLVTGTVPASHLCLIYYYLRIKPKKSSALLPKEHI